MISLKTNAQKPSHVVAVHVSPWHVSLLSRLKLDANLHVTFNLQILHTTVGLFFVFACLILLTDAHNFLPGKKVRTENLEITLNLDCTWEDCPEMLKTYNLEMGGSKQHVEAQGSEILWEECVLLASEAKSPMQALEAPWLRECVDSEILWVTGTSRSHLTPD